MRLLAAFLVVFAASCWSAENKWPIGTWGVYLGKDKTTTTTVTITETTLTFNKASGSTTYYFRKPLDPEKHGGYFQLKDGEKGSVITQSINYRASANNPIRAGELNFGAEAPKNLDIVELKSPADWGWCIFLTDKK